MCSRGAVATLAPGCLPTSIMAAARSSKCSSDSERRDDLGTYYTCLEPYGTVQRFHTSWFLYTSKQGFGSCSWRAADSATAERAAIDASSSER